MFAGDLSQGASRRAAWFDSVVFDHSFFRMGWSNFAEVIPGKLYRANHPTPGRLARLTQRLGLRTLINLRGHRACGSDALSRDAAARLGLDHIDMAFESRGAPHRERILRFHEIYRSMRTPALMHCKSGADRAGLASGLAILFEGGTAAQALGQLSWRFGHISRSSTGILDAFFVHYAAVAEGRKPFLDWVREDYDEAALRAGFVAHGLASFLTDRVLIRE
ncbi:MAG: protein tyrosine phosphatase [Acetobacteraceae bacterium SCN 69-10]|nr:tyrosine-protein phosphatase [Rhodospirillales bacterium]ODU60489.1 MAG: protein tyrosine phosphatase [Acetobacteraceae bacterium SCN 69-10]OJY77450.1 MAG: protein tyrosine phosphatase [Rhodospirillales bacterium 70-18]